MFEDEIDAILAKFEGIAPLGGESFVPPAEKELAGIERLIGAPLPADYRFFLAKYGASRFEVAVLFPSIETLPELLSCDGKGAPNMLYGSKLDDDIDESCQLDPNIRRYKGRIPTGLIPFGSDAGGEQGNQLCLGVSGPDKGKIFFWIHEDQRGGLDEGDPTEASGAGPKVTFLVADSFEDFIRSIEIYDF